MKLGLIPGGAMSMLPGGPGPMLGGRTGGAVRPGGPGWLLECIGPLKCGGLTPGGLTPGGIPPGGLIPGKNHVQFDILLHIRYFCSVKTSRSVEFSS